MVRRRPTGRVFGGTRADYVDHPKAQAQAAKVAGVDLPDPLSGLSEDEEKREDIKQRAMRTVLHDYDTHREHVNAAQTRQVLEMLGLIPQEHIWVPDFTKPNKKIRLTIEQWKARHAKLLELNQQMRQDKKSATSEAERRLVYNEYMNQKHQLNEAIREAVEMLQRGEPDE